MVCDFEFHEKIDSQEKGSDQDAEMSMCIQSSSAFIQGRGRHAFAAMGNNWSGVLAEGVLAHSSVNRGDDITTSMLMSGSLTHWALAFPREATSDIAGSRLASTDHDG